MNAKTTLSILSLVLGEAVIVGAFFLWKGDTPDNVFTLNLIVSSLIYCMLFVDVLVPWVDFKEVSHKRVGTIGLRWFITGVYAVLAVCGMILMPLLFGRAFEPQLVFQCALAFALLLGFVGMMHTSDKIAEVSSEEIRNKQGLSDMKSALAKLQENMHERNVPVQYIDAVNGLSEEIRYIAPSNEPEAHLLEKEFTAIIDSIVAGISNFEMNREQIDSELKKAHRICINRKSIYSN